MPAATKVTVNIPTDILEQAKKLASDQGLNFTTYLRDALLTEKYFHDAMARGEKILLEDKKGKVKEIVFKR